MAFGDLIDRNIDAIAHEQRQLQARPSCVDRKQGLSRAGHGA
jgi:hypothetical protein